MVETQSISGKRKEKKPGRGLINKRLLFDSDEEDIDLKNEYDVWHNAKRDLAMRLLQATNLPDLALIGFGFPQRTPSYIGVHKKWLDEEEYRKAKDN